MEDENDSSCERLFKSIVGIWKSLSFLTIGGGGRWGIVQVDSRFLESSILKSRVL